MKKSSFGILFAIFVLIIISIVSIYTLELSSIASKESVDDMLYIQADLYEQSAIEWAILQLQNGITPETINFGDGYKYSFIVTPIHGSDLVLESRGMVIIDVIGEVTILGTEPSKLIRTHKRVIQKP